MLKYCARLSKNINMKANSIKLNYSTLLYLGMLMKYLLKL